MLKNDRAAGVLLGVSSLPSRYAIGGFGRESVDFAKCIQRGGFNRWQILPLTTCGVGNSPYSGFSAFAGNYLFISPEMLQDEGFIGEGDVRAAICDEARYVVDYERAKATKKRLLYAAFDNMGQSLLYELSVFEKENAWVSDYALFMAIKENDSRAWWEWDTPLKLRNASALAEFREQNIDSVNFYIFEQYIFDRQWRQTKSLINDLGVAIIGDMPIYVAEDSVEVWSTPEQFLLDKELRPTLVAGVPPDYFSAEGQLWGNPLYDYSVMKKDGYKWWLSRFARMNQLYDYLRIDHFRGLDRFWAVEASAKSAKDGKWVKANGAEIIQLVKKEFPNLKMIAEDLGTIDDGVRELLAKSGLDGMRVMQFGFCDGDSTNLAHNFDTNCVAYTGTHDNDTTLGWFYSLDENVRNYALDYIECSRSGWGEGGANCTCTRAMIKTLLKSSARLAIVPFQDICGYGSDCRTNIPGVAEGNWTFRAVSDALNGADWKFFLDINNLYGRNRKYVKADKV